MKYRSPHEIAARKVRSKKRFYRHFAVFLASMFLMFSINIFNYRWHVGVWAIYPLVTWGSMILLQYLLVFGFPITGALSEEWEIEAAFVGCGGSIPIAGYFQQITGVDPMLIGFAKDDDQIHSPNEKYDLESFQKGIRSWVRVINSFSGLQNV